ncbi:hypothetical protein GH5_03287 [Leishmania sp. Ghana 2012 LV757]|uniref:hypothetical protein n=1 Tax=Leishmania sp. Ghana 2012 LV757 TaxID=2803181 RepID=UPI001B5836A9|nr:hypothetical protein GH5_03287 [Leishmania sp. Ghana 2012 LV757]
MLQPSLLHGALCISYRALKSAAVVPVGAASAAPVSSRRGEASESSIEFAEAIEKLSNEVFGRGNRHLKNVETLTALPEGLHSFPEVCFIGKPGCGKSSLISCLLRNRRLGKAGATAGTTRLLQFFNVGDALLLVDTPGYGGWRGRDVGQRLAEQANAFSILFRYLALRNGSNLKRVYWLVESSARTPVSFQSRDEELLAFLSRERIPFSVVLTKIDRHWRHYAEQQRTTDRVGKNGFVDPGHRRPKAHGQGFLRTSLPEDGVARNMQEVYEFLGTDQVPILGVSANRLQPHRSHNLDLLQHDIVHYCTQDLLPSEELSFRNMQKLSYAPPTADRIYEVQLRYPVESFVVPENNNISLARMVEHHEHVKARFLANNVSARRLSAKDVAACHLESVAKLRAASQGDAAQRVRAERVLPRMTHLSESSLTTAATTSVPLPGDVAGSVRTSEEQGTVAASIRRLGDLPEQWKECGDHHPEAGVADVRACRSFCVRPLLGGERDKSLDPLEGILESASVEEEPLKGAKVDVVGDGEKSTAAAPSSHYAHGGADSVSHAVLPQEQSLAALPLPAMLDPNAHYVTAIDGTPIPRSMISVSVEQLALSKDDELAHFATKSGAGAYEELLLVDQEKGDAGTDFFVEASDAALLSEEAQAQLASRGHRTRSAARKQEERFLAKYVERKRKERSIYMQAEGYMCPWLGRSEGRNAVQGFAGARGSGRGGIMVRDLKQKGFGGKSYSARTMKNRGRATKKTGFWAA